MLITGVTKARGQLVKITCDDGASYEIDRTVAAENCLVEGETLTPARLQSILDLSQKKRAKSRALWYLSRTDCSQGEMLSKLKRAGFPQSACREAVDKLCELGLIDDVRYAGHLAHIYKERNLSLREAVAKITAKHINSEIARQAVAAEGFDGVEAIRVLMQRKYAKKLTDAKGRQAVFAALARKGFSVEDIKSALQEYSTDEDFYY